MSSGTRSLMNEVLMVAAIAIASVWIIANFETVKQELGLEKFLPSERVMRAEEAQSGAAGEPGSIRPIGYVELDSDGRGHYNSAIEINGRAIEAMVDTGASVVALSYEDARRSGLFIGSSDYTGRVRTANGVAKVAPVSLERVRIGDILIRNVRGVVAEPGKLDGTLLGMSFLSRLKRVEIKQGRLILQQ